MLGPPPPSGHRAQPAQGPTGVPNPLSQGFPEAPACCLKLGEAAFIPGTSSQGPYPGKLWGQISQPHSRPCWTHCSQVTFRLSLFPYLQRGAFCPPVAKRL